MEGSPQAGGRPLMEKRMPSYARGNLCASPHGLTCITTNAVITRSCLVWAPGRLSGPEGRHFSPPRGRMETAPQEHERFIASLNHVRTPLGACANLVRATQGDALTLHLIGSADDL